MRQGILSGHKQTYYCTFAIDVDPVRVRRYEKPEKRCGLYIKEEVFASLMFCHERSRRVKMPIIKSRLSTRDNHF